MAEEAKRIDKPNETKIMVAMQVRNENMRDLTAAYFVIDKLDLGSFSAINKVIVAVKGYYLACGMTVKCRYCRIIA